ncbi:MAG: 3-hydroxyacyl-ACP dehydratase FabZ [Lachnospiraceae bacterium]|nr:3-hydroxyacyl-ACP dehydratase FabZ [Lachnospiraceae bacterium]
MELNINEIMKIIPHRYPFLLVDKITDYEPGVWAKGIKCVSANEMQFMGHFPDYPVMPGVLMIEAMAQTGAVAILSMEENKGKIAFFGGIKNARFRSQVFPGDVMEMEVKIIKQKGPIGIGEGTVTVNGKVAVNAELTFAVQ